jgi:ADP-ribose pyrophosphatase YjhB (NUDIX family)
MRTRLAGRVIAVDPQDRVLLFRYDERPPNGVHWSTPGGGLDDGESYEAGALRELIEETGWTDVPLGPLVYEHELTMRFGKEMIRQRECLFSARVTEPCRPVLNVAGMHESDNIAAWRWWTLAELDATDEVFWPANLAELIRGMRAQAVKAD